MKKITLIAITALMFAGVDYANGEVHGGEHNIRTGFGVTLPFLKTRVNDMDIDMGNVGGDIGASYIYNLTANIGLGIGVGDSFLTEKKMENSPIAGQTTRSFADVFYTEAIARYLIMPEKRSHPYLIAGVGYTEVYESVKWIRNSTFGPITIPIESTRFTKTEVGYTASVGAGYEYEISQRWTVGADVIWRYLGIGSEFEGLFGNKVKTEPGSILKSGLYVAFKFGGK